MKVLRTVEARIATEAVFIVFGAVHSFGVARASVYARDGWQTPLGPLQVDRALAERLLADAGELLIEDQGAHAAEHSIEVQLPMVRYVFGDRRIVPIAAPPRDDSHEVGRRVAEICRQAGREVFVLGTTDLTHYGAMGYRFAPMGSGRAGLDWVKNENDPRMIRLMRDLEADQVVAEAAEHRNACGAGAVAATLGAARELGSQEGHLIEYTTSYDVLRGQFPGDAVSDFVGYAGMVF
jgi:AmmeMemoRadiSam system protein B